VGREESEERAAKLKKLAVLQKHNDELKQSMKEFADMDPDLVARMGKKENEREENTRRIAIRCDMIVFLPLSFSLEKDAKVARDAANRWTGNASSTSRTTTRTDTFFQTTCSR
jgi:hypothetical protein